jgi:hypothetical protein
MRIGAFLAALLVFVPTLSLANLNDDFAACRQIILKIGSDPTAPADQYCLGLSYAFALNHPRDLAKAAVWFRKAAEHNHAAAQALLGYLYERGDGVKADPAEAAKLYRKAADQGHAKAQNHLGVMYEDGIGVKEDWAEAVRWYRKSVEQGEAEGQFNLGRAYQFGMAVPQSRQNAISWFDKAGDQGHDQANYFANDLKQRNRYIGFRNDQEHAAVVGMKLRGVLLNIEPVGRTFRNSAERMAYLTQAGKQADREEEMLRWESKNREYKACQDSGGSGCIRPSPSP